MTDVIYACVYCGRLYNGLATLKDHEGECPKRSTKNREWWDERLRKIEKDAKRKDRR